MGWLSLHFDPSVTSQLFSKSGEELQVRRVCKGGQGWAEGQGQGGARVDIRKSGEQVHQRRNVNSSLSSMAVSSSRVLLMSSLA